VVPEKQGLKQQRIDLLINSAWSLSSGSRKTRIETAAAKMAEILLFWSKQWFQKNKD